MNGQPGSSQVFKWQTIQSYTSGVPSATLHYIEYNNSCAFKMQSSSYAYSGL